MGITAKLTFTIAAIIAIDTAVAVYIQSNAYNDMIALLSIVQVLFLLAAALLLISKMGTVTAKPVTKENQAFSLNTSAKEHVVILSALLEHTPCSICAVSTQYEILMVNNAFTSLMGFQKNEVTGRRCFDVLGTGAVCSNCPVPLAVQTKTVQRNPRQQYMREGTRAFFAQTAVPILDGKGEVKYILEMAADVTQEVELEREKKDLFLETVTSLAKLIGSRDQYTGTHSVQVQKIAVAIGQELGLDADVIGEISIAAILHDIGKIGIPENILNKKGQLTENEYEIIKRHPEIGYEALVNIAPLQKVAEYILHHHERFDGLGYPGGKRGMEIPLVSRILSIADVYEAITANRVYRAAMSAKEARKIMMNGRGTQFDPLVLDAFFCVLNRKGLPIGEPVSRLRGDDQGLRLAE